MGKKANIRRYLSRVRCSETGVPVISDRDIEGVAYILLKEYAEHCLNIPSITPVSQVLTSLKDKEGLKVLFESFESDGAKLVLGRTVFSEKTIIFNELLQDGDMQHMFLFTAAHEIGHFVLHSGLKIRSEKNEVIDDSKDNEEMFPWKRTNSLVTSRDWIEHHANVFAAFFLMPRKMFHYALVKAQEEIGVTRNVGKVILQDIEYSRRDFRMIMTKLREVFGASETAIRIHMKTLDILDDRTKPDRLR